MVSHSFLDLLPPPSPLGDYWSPLLWIGIMYFSLAAILLLLPKVLLHSLSFAWLLLVVYLVYYGPWGVSLLHSYLILVIRLNGLIFIQGVLYTTRLDHRWSLALAGCITCFDGCSPHFGICCCLQCSMGFLLMINHHVIWKLIRHRRPRIILRKVFQSKIIL